MKESTYKLTKAVVYLTKDFIEDQEIDTNKFVIEVNGKILRPIGWSEEYKDCFVCRMLELQEES